MEKVLDEVRPGLMADGGNVALHEIDGLVVVLKLMGACGSCPSSTMTLKMGIETRLRDKIPEIMDVEQILDTETGLELNEENVEKVWISEDQNTYHISFHIDYVDLKSQFQKFDSLRMSLNCRFLQRLGHTWLAQVVGFSSLSRSRTIQLKFV